MNQKSKQVLNVFRDLLRPYCTEKWSKGECQIADLCPKCLRVIMVHMSLWIYELFAPPFAPLGCPYCPYWPRTTLAYRPCDFCLTPILSAVPSEKKSYCSTACRGQDKTKQAMVLVRCVICDKELTRLHHRICGKDGLVCDNKICRRVYWETIKKKNNVYTPEFFERLYEYNGDFCVFSPPCKEPPIPVTEKRPWKACERHSLLIESALKRQYRQRTEKEKFFNL